MRQGLDLLFVLLLLCNLPSDVDAQPEIVGFAIGVISTWFGIPFALSSIGFGSTIARGSWASYLMSYSARSGYLSRLVAFLQSVGAAGPSWGTIFFAGIIGAVLGHLFGRMRQRTIEGNQDDPQNKND